MNGDFAGVKRARYSALTKDEIQRAFDNLDELDAARQRRRRSPGHGPDLGATLTRAVSMATCRFGSNFLSVGGCRARPSG